MQTIRLGVNVDHVATVRQARGTMYPDPVAAGLLAEEAGADGVTVHLREDRRHIQERDVRELLARLQVPLNLEMAITNDMLAFAIGVRPAHACLVPEKRQELTTEGGLDIVARQAAVRTACMELAAAGIRVSLFIDPEPRQILAARQAGAAVVELHTGAYADALEAGQRTLELRRLQEAARQAADLGLEVHAGHGLNAANVGPIAALPELAELNIGHAIVARALFVGLAAAVQEMRQAMDKGRQSA